MKTVNVKAKLLLQPPSGTQKIDIKYLQKYKLTKKRLKIPRRINLLIFFLLTYLIESNLPIKTRLTKRTKTTKEVFGNAKDKNRFKVTIPL